MKLFDVLIMLIFLSYCNGHMRSDRRRGIATQNITSRKIETYTTIMLDDESYSILPIVRHLKKKMSTLTPRKEETGFPKIKSSSKKYHRPKGSKIGEQSRVKVGPNFSLSLEKSNRFFGKHTQKLPSHRLKNKGYGPKNVRKRHFEQIYHTQNESINPLISIPNPLKYNSGNPDTNVALPRSLNNGISTDVPYNSTQNASENSKMNSQPLSPKTNLQEPFPRNENRVKLGSSDSKRGSNQDPYSNQGYETGLQENGVLLDSRNNVRSLGEFVSSARMLSGTSTLPPMHSMMFHQADIIQRNSQVGRQQSKVDKQENENSPEDDGTDSDDTKINFAETCEQIINETCWMQREVGDVLTLAIKIDSGKDQKSFQVRWMKVYHVFDSKKGKPLEIEPGKLPWNMVSGSEGRELRLNPVANTDFDPNYIVAKVFLLTKHGEKTHFTQLKKLTFHIDIPIIDMGKIYAGEELSINIENFISLPERGNLLFDWKLETRPRQYVSLPSTAKISSTGRSVIIKELRKGRMGVLNCIVYSSSSFAVAKRRFNILKIAESVRRRSTATNWNSAILDLKRSRKCRHIIRRSQEQAMQWLRERRKPRSRQKRYKRTRTDSDELLEKDCEPLKRKLYSRLVRSLLADFTTEDPKLIPLEKLFELSEQGDGTLDDVIPREIHYVKPVVKVLPGTSNERSVGHSPHFANCTSNKECGENAVCVTQKRNTLSMFEKNLGYCNCLPEFYGDGHACQPIPVSNHREKRLRRSIGRDFAVPKHLFYERAKDGPSVTTREEVAEDEVDREQLAKILAFEEEESFMLSDCIDDKDCSSHASCIQPTNGHPYCKCRPGFRGNGLFCWETMDYVPIEGQFLAGEEVEPTDLSEDNLVSKRPGLDGMEDE